MKYVKILASSDSERSEGSKKQIVLFSYMVKWKQVNKLKTGALSMYT